LRVVAAMAALSTAMTISIVGIGSSAAGAAGANTGVAVATGVYTTPGSSITSVLVYPLIQFYGPLTIDGTVVPGSFQVTNVQIRYHGGGNDVNLVGFSATGPQYSGTCHASQPAGLVLGPLNLDCQVGFAAPTTAVLLHVVFAPGLPVQNSPVPEPGVYTDQNLPVT